MQGYIVHIIYRVVCARVYSSYNLQCFLSKGIKFSEQGYKVHIIYRVVCARVYSSYNLQGCLCKGI